MKKAVEYAFTAESQVMETTVGAIFGACNAVTDYFQYVREYKNNEHKVKSILYGGTVQLKGQRVFSLCEAYFKNGQFSLN